MVVQTLHSEKFSGSTISAMDPIYRKSV